MGPILILSFLQYIFFKSFYCIGIRKFSLEYLIVSPSTMIWTLWYFKFGKTRLDIHWSNLPNTFSTGRRNSFSANQFDKATKLFYSGLMSSQHSNALLKLASNSKQVNDLICQFVCLITMFKTTRLVAFTELVIK